MKHAIFLDTMIYLHYRPVREVDWHKLIGASATEAIVIVVPGITLRELDKHKNETPRLRERAQRVIDLLMRSLTPGAGAVRPGVSFVGFLARPAVDYQELALDESNNDDVLVASVLAYARAHPEVSVGLATEDGYPAMRATGLNLAVYRMPDELMLPVDDEVERENKALKRQLQKLESSRPAVDIEVEGGGKTYKVQLVTVPPLSEAEVTSAIADIERRFPSADSFRPKATRPKPASSKAPDLPQTPALKALGPMVDLSQIQALRDAVDAFGGLQFSERDIVRYEEQRTAYLATYAEYLKRQRRVESERARRIVLTLYLNNTGAAPATDIDVHFHIPDPFDVLGKDLLVDQVMPQEPALPKRRSAIADLMALDAYPTIPSWHDFGTRNFNVSGRPAPAANVSGLSIKRSNSYDATCHVTRAKHGLRIPLPVLYLSANGATPLRPFQVAYSLYAANIPDVIEGTINVVVTTPTLV